MDTSYFILIAGCWLVTIFSLACALYMFMLLREGYAPWERALQKGVFIFFLLYAGIYLIRLCYRSSPALFVIGQPLFYACHTFIGPTLYYIVFKLTSGESYKKFPRIHFIPPLIMPVTIAIWMNFVPLEVPLGIVKGFREYNPDWPLFSRVFASIIPAEILFDTFYLVLSWITLHRYQRSLPKNKREDKRYMLNWIYLLMFILFNTWIHPVIVVFTSMESVFQAYWFTASSSLMIVSIQIILLNNFQQRNYPLLDPQLLESDSSSDKTSISSKKKKDRPSGRQNGFTPKAFSKKDFENYFKREKPYLDPSLKLTTLAEKMNMSREEVSQFINQAYGVNFNTYIGQWRLEELERLRRLKKNQGLPIKEILPQAGFAYYNSYMRARQESERRRNNKGTNEKRNGNYDT